MSMPWKTKKLRKCFRLEMTDETQHLKAVSDPGLDPGFEKNWYTGHYGEKICIVWACNFLTWLLSCGCETNACSKKIHNEVLGSKGTWFIQVTQLVSGNVYMCVCGEREKHGKILIGKYKWRVQRCSLWYSVSFLCVRSYFKRVIKVKIKTQ